ncbi:hypothetical protein HDE_06674 [Halotydeus destructor]|nr:hypothetical protein HDE_06674 [Halotydeus destructor]
MKCSRDQRSNGQNRSVIWYAVAANLLDGGHGQKLTSDFCRQQFEKLARDYLKCKQTGDSQWHYYRVFCDRVEPALGSKWLCDLIAAGDCGQVELIQPKAIHLEQQLTEAADVHALKQLVSAVIRNGDMILLSNASEYEFWQKISYELTKYVSPMNKEAWTTWRTHFYDGFHKFLNLSESANSSNWPLYQDYSSISGPLLEELKARKDNLNEEEQSRRASSASPPENAFKLVASYRPRERHRPLYWDTSDIPRKLQLVRLIATRLPALEDPMAREWSDMKRIMVSTGYLAPGAKIDLRSYFISMVRNYVETMTVATSNTEGNKMCPYFHLMKKLDLGPFLPKTGPCTERDAYLKLKAKFVK